MVKSNAPDARRRARSASARRLHATHERIVRESFVFRFEERRTDRVACASQIVKVQTAPPAPARPTGPNAQSPPLIRPPRQPPAQKVMSVTCPGWLDTVLVSSLLRVKTDVGCSFRNGGASVPLGAVGALGADSPCFSSYPRPRTRRRRGAGLSAVAVARDRSGTIVSPRASIATIAAIFFARPAGVFMLLVRNASAKRFTPTQRAEGLRRPRVGVDRGAEVRRESWPCSRFGSAHRPRPSGRRPWRHPPAAGRAVSSDRRR